MITADATIIAPPRATPYQAAAAILAHPHGEYDDVDICTTIVPGYFIVCRTVGVDPLVGIAQMIHETGNLTSWWSQRPRRNPAGIGVTGHQTALGAGPPLHIITQWVAKDGRWVAGLTFLTWADNAIPAHVGRLVAYATKPEQRTEAQIALVARAMYYRDLPLKCHGSAPTLRELGTDPNTVDGCGWASPGQGYGAALAVIMNHIRGL